MVDLARVIRAWFRDTRSIRVRSNMLEHDWHGGVERMKTLKFVQRIRAGLIEQLDSAKAALMR